MITVDGTSKKETVKKFSDEKGPNCKTLFFTAKRVFLLPVKRALVLRSIPSKHMCEECAVRTISVGEKINFK